jgi:hypothetical protein
MRLGRVNAWTSLACLGAVLTVASGCQMPVPEEGDPNTNQDPSKFQPGTDPNMQIPPSGATSYMPAAPAARKLGLDLTGVAGFAILDADSQDSSQSSSPGTISGAAGAPSGGSAMWLESSGAGQLLVRNISRLGLERFAPAGATTPGAALSGLSQEDPGATPTPPSGDVAAPSSGTTSSGTTSSGSGADANVGEQAGLLKITEDGELLPALVALEPDPAPTSTTPTGTSSTGATTGDKPAPTGDPAPTGSSPTPTSGSGGASGSGTASSGTTNTGTAPPPVNMPGPQSEPLPRVTALALSPDGSVYVLFEHGFIYRTPSAEEQSTQGFDPFSPQSPLRCQLFRADGSWKGDGAHDVAQLECVTSDYQVPTWDVKRVMQFDASGKLYFRGMTQNTPQGVFLQFDPTTKHLSEKVNANICWRDVQVTPRGSLFYTGSSGGSDGSCGGTSFFRYVTADNRLTEIARDWWNFKYLAEQDPNDPENERIIFYGPDPNTASSNGWDTACLYRYNPAIATAADRTQKLVECYRDGSSYVQGQTGMQMGPMPQQQISDEQLPAYLARCESEGQLFISGDSVSAISQLQDGTLFVVGKFQRKLAGEIQCGLQVSGDHCALLGTGSPGDALDPVNDTQQSCTDAGHVWLSSAQGCTNPDYNAPDTCTSNGFYWNPGGMQNRSYQMTGAACMTTGVGITRNYLSCQAPNQTGMLSQEVDGLGYLAPATDSTPAHLELLSDPAEQVERYWPVPGPNGAQLFYSVYNAGQYNLRMATQVHGEGGAVTIQRKPLLDDYEVYNLQRDPSHSNRVMFDALQFSTNSYLFGSIDASLATPEAVQASLQIVDGVSGKVETLIVLPNF